MQYLSKGQEYIKTYKQPLKPLKPVSGTFLDSKKLKDGSMLELRAGVSVLEFPGTVTHILRIRSSKEDSPMDGNALLYRPESAMISEAGYRTIMGLIETKKDFYALQKKLQPIAKETFELLRNTAAEKAN